MNKLDYFRKYISYLAKKMTACAVADSHFHASRLKRISGREHDLRHPVTLSEKICHRMLYDRNPLYTLLADKLAVRDYVHARTDQLRIVPLLGVYHKVSDIDFNALPQRFVLKCNHDSGSAVVCLDKDELNVGAAINKLSLALKKNMYYSTREWQYKDIAPVILCEKYIDVFTHGNKNQTPEMLRLHCFHGVAEVIEADFTDEEGNGYINVYNRAWQLQPYQMEYPNTPGAIPEPDLLQRAIGASERLAKGIDYCRIDLMPTQEGIYFSEITLSPRRGKLKIVPAEWDTRLGEMWRLNLT
ncbi:ATP-grasp fold amidoligase family protein [Kosakonia cowanii]|uniref:ATP-grasp fold amidoligase family protein n=1 Tax=Kosakonia cowanii TaxID=208223 RepID=UPI0022E8E392|nr:ATP-grasp fold amidoligase family protein [Kosakonia cowanii]